MMGLLGTVVMPWLAKHVGLVRGGAWSIWFVSSYPSLRSRSQTMLTLLLPVNQVPNTLPLPSSPNSLHRTSSHRAARFVPLSSSLPPRRSSPSLRIIPSDSRFPLLFLSNNQVKAQSGTSSSSSPSSPFRESVRLALSHPSFLPSLDLNPNPAHLFVIFPSPLPPFPLLLLSLSFVVSALWSIDLIQLQILQEALRDHPRRNRLTSLQLSLQSAFDLSKYAVVLGFNECVSISFQLLLSVRSSVEGVELVEVRKRDRRVSN